jgi:hypothetical protein
MHATKRLREVVGETYTAVRFLENYLQGAHGYTTQDVQAGVKRLETLCRVIEEAEEAGQYTAASDAVLEAAADCLANVRDKLASVTPP